jgi:hypothetical protein
VGLSVDMFLEIAHDRAALGNRLEFRAKRDADEDVVVELWEDGATAPITACCVPRHAVVSHVSLMGIACAISRGACSADPALFIRFVSVAIWMAYDTEETRCARIERPRPRPTADIVAHARATLSDLDGKLASLGAQ